MKIGQTVYVGFARMRGTVINVEWPYPDQPDVELFEIELEDGRLCYALATQCT